MFVYWHYMYILQKPSINHVAFDYLIHFSNGMYFRKMTLITATGNQHVPDPRL